MKTIFKKIIDGEMEAEKVFEDDKILVIKDKFPIAPVHLLIIPKKEIKDIQSLKKEDFDLLTNIFEISQKLADQFNLKDGYRLLTNNGKNAGQTIFHLHFHLIGGKRIGPMG